MAGNGVGFPSATVGAWGELSSLELEVCKVCSHGYIEPMTKSKPKATAQYLPLDLSSVELWRLPTQGYSPVGICGSLPGFVTHEAIHC